jgi:hypothetical protein
MTTQKWSPHDPIEIVEKGKKTGGFPVSERTTTISYSCHINSANILPGRSMAKLPQVSTAAFCSSSHIDVESTPPIWAFL